jgi:hypothetical protein
MKSKIPLILSLAANVIITGSFVYFMNDWSEKQTQLVYDMTKPPVCVTRANPVIPPTTVAMASGDNSASR